RRVLPRQRQGGLYGPYPERLRRKPAGGGRQLTDKRVRRNPGGSLPVYDRRRDGVQDRIHAGTDIGKPVQRRRSRAGRFRFRPLGGGAGREGASAPAGNEPTRQSLRNPAAAQNDNLRLRQADRQV